MRHLLCHLWLAAARWPPENPCEGLGPEECTARSTCEMDCRSSGLTYRPHTCWPVRGDGWGCDYYGGRYFCSGGPWSCKSGFGKISGNGCCLDAFSSFCATAGAGTAATPSAAPAPLWRTVPGSTSPAALPGRLLEAPCCICSHLAALYATQVTY
ncbi:unnamed protein product [Effrenium voratum]|nr:unnamed protein product [Effrenium voratum]